MKELMKKEGRGHRSEYSGFVDFSLETRGQMMEVEHRSLRFVF
jgi:hypothetical protein